ncbi:MAG: hypothetical protein IKQ55_06450 [Kiritimatiellae bacterium]|nr:hypothetical protein [Kiritimatiellia bacterium]
MKKLMTLLAAFAAGACLLAFPVRAAADGDAVLLVAPARYSVMQVAFDVARRYPTVLVSYQKPDPDPRLHVWNGYEWLPLPLEDYRSGAFLQSYPSRTFLLGDNALLPNSLRDIGSWCKDTRQIRELETPELINAVGQGIPFTPSDWRWFAGRYNLKLADASADRRKQLAEESWYDGSAPVKDAPPSFFKYFTRSRRSERSASAAPIEPLEPAPGEMVEPAAPAAGNAAEPATP